MSTKEDPYTIAELVAMYHRLHAVARLMGIPEYLLFIYERNYKQIVTDWLNEGMAFGL